MAPSFGPIYLMAAIDVVLTVVCLSHGAAEANPNVRVALNLFGGGGYLFIRLGLIGIVETLVDLCPKGDYTGNYYNFLLWSHLVLMGYWAVWMHAAQLL